MKRFNLITAIVALILLTAVACKKSQVKTPQLEGNYKGTYQRVGPALDNKTANVTLTLNTGKWTGQSDIANYPALCNGTYTFTRNKINFENNCAFTANFNWTLILSGEYEFSQTGNELKITKNYGNESDIYRLTKQ
ncbi:hypothetical protein [Mucilaginibacter sp. PAMB04168]|uniref:hypothetical protein n=1 Tax=Mucilaginibacter sp. PAMB04168 TaxID=3138567 RepID=UPI0031F69668